MRPTLSQHQYFPYQSLDKNERKMNFYVDLIRAYAIVMVIMVHSAALPMLNFSSISQSEWWVSNLLFSFAHQGVPLFIMISGLLLLDPAKNEPTAVFVKKRFRKIIIPLIFWSAFFYCWRVFYKAENLTIIESISNAVNGPMYYHLWYLYLILGLYLATPILRVYTKTAPLSITVYFIAVWFLFEGMIPLINGMTGIRPGIPNTIFTSVIGYYLMGYLFLQVDIPDKFKWLIAAVAVAATLFTAIGTHLLTIRSDNQYKGFFVNISRPNIITLSFCIFFLMYKFKHASLFTKGRAPLYIRRIAVSSFGIYLLHPVILELLEAGWSGFNVNAMSIHPIVGIPMTMVLTITISYVVVTNLRKIPYIKSIVP